MPGAWAEGELSTMPRVTRGSDWTEARFTDFRRDGSLTSIAYN